MQTHIGSLRNIYSDFSRIGFQAAASANAPTLSSYSPVPSMQQIANQHSSAIGTSTGCAILVTNAILREIEWASNNIKSLADSLEHQEASLASTFNDERTVTRLNSAVSIQFSHNFATRPEFQVGQLSFSPAALTSELKQSADYLLAAFEATQDSLITDAQRFWENLGEKMDSDSESIRNAAERLRSEHEGDAFSAAATQLTGFSDRISLVAQSSGEMASSLKPLPEIKATAISRIKEILEQSNQLEDPTERKHFEQDEVHRFLEMHYLPELQTTIPTIPSLTTPNHAGGLTSVETQAAQRISPIELVEDHRTQTSAPTYAASSPSFQSSAASPVNISQPLPTLPSSVGGSGANLLATSSQGSTPSTTVGQPELRRTRQHRLESGQTKANSLRTGASPLATQTTVNRGATGPSANLSDRRVSTNMPRNAGSPMMGVPAPARLPESPGTASRLLGTPQSSGGANGQPIHGNTTSDRNRSPAGGALRGGTSIAPVSSLGSSGKRSTSPIDQVSKLRRNDSTNANHKRLFGSTEPTVPEILGADLRD